MQGVKPLFKSCSSFADICLVLNRGSIVYPPLAEQPRRLDMSQPRFKASIELLAYSSLYLAYRLRSDDQQTVTRGVGGEASVGSIEGWGTNIAWDHVDGAIRSIVKWLKDDLACPTKNDWLRGLQGH